MNAGSFKHVIGYAVVLLLALGGSAQALPGRSTVDSGDIVNGQVKRVDLAARAVTSGKVKDGTLLGQDLAPGTLGGQQVDEGGLDYAGAGCKVGLVHSFVQIPAFMAVSATPVALGGHNCSGGQILVSHPSGGVYRVRFVGDPAVLGVAQSVTGINNVGVRKDGNEFVVEQRNYNGDLVSNAIAVMTY